MLFWVFLSPGIFLNIVLLLNDLSKIIFHFQHSLQLADICTRELVLGWSGTTLGCCWELGWARTLQKDSLHVATLFQSVTEFNAM